MSEKVYTENPGQTSGGERQLVPKHAAGSFISRVILVAVLVAAALFFGSAVFEWLYSGDSSVNLSGMSRADLESLAQSVAEQLHYLPLERRDGGSSFLKSTAFKVLMGIAVFAVLNVVAITAHHLVQKVKRSTNLYRSVEHVVSPF